MSVGLSFKAKLAGEKKIPYREGGALRSLISCIFGNAGNLKDLTIPSQRFIIIS